VESRVHQAHSFLFFFDIFDIIPTWVVAKKGHFVKEKKKKKKRVNLLPAVVFFARIVFWRLHPSVLEGTRIVYL